MLILIFFTGSTVGEKLNNRYLVVKLLGKGVFSSVVLANDLLDGGNEVAVKIIRNNDTMCVYNFN